jgi:lactobin A/cerein 7B family class IIb bacteriocin
MKELSMTELEDIDGGAFPLLLSAAAAVAGMVAAGIIADWADFKEGFIEGYNYTSQ